MRVEYFEVSWVQKRTVRSGQSRMVVGHIDSDPSPMYGGLGA